MRRYDLPLWAADTNRFPDSGVVGAGWRLFARYFPDHRYGSKAWWRHFHSMRRKYPQYSVHHIGVGEHSWVAPQLVADAHSRRAAQRLFELVSCAITLIEGNVLSSFEDGLVLPSSRRNCEDLSNADFLHASHPTFSSPSTILGSLLAAKLSRGRTLTYSAFKLRLSYEIASTHWIELDPWHGAKKFSVSTGLADHVRLASAITLAYSAIEELQLEPRPQGKRPIMERGIWDVAALTNLRDRLKESSVDLDNTITWSARGSQTRIHRYSRFPKGAKTPWTRGVVRDRSVTVEDALLAASWLRSKCSTHKYRDETRSMTMYDVANVQHLARRLLLERTRIWPLLLKR